MYRGDERRETKKTWSKKSSKGQPPYNPRRCRQFMRIVKGFFAYKTIPLALIIPVPEDLVDPPALDTSCPSQSSLSWDHISSVPQKIHICDDSVDQLSLPKNLRTNEPHHLRDIRGTKIHYPTCNETVIIEMILKRRH